MYRISSLLLFLALSLQGTTVYLRYGAPGSFTKITTCTNATPVVCTAAGHGLSNGDLVYVQQVYGTSSANGLRKIASAATNTFALTTTSDVNVVGNGAYLYGGIVGKVQAYTLKDHPRLMLDGPAGSISTAIVGRDQVGHVPYDALKQICDGSIVNSNPAATGPGAFLCSLGWYMNNAQTAWRDKAKSFLTNIEKHIANGTTAYQWYPGPFTATTLGRGSDVDWSSHYAAPFAYAYSLLRDQLSEGEKTALLGKMLNNADPLTGETCTNPIESWGAGTVTQVDSSKVVTGSGTNFLSTLSPGDFVFALYPHQTSTNIPGRLMQVASVQSDTQFTAVNNNITTYPNGGKWAKVRSWQSGDCGWRWYTRGHSFTPTFDRPKLTSRLASSLDGTSTSVSLTTAIGLTPPYNISAEVVWSETMTVTAINGNTFTVTRGTAGHAMSYAAGTTLSGSGVSVTLAQNVTPTQTVLTFNSVPGSPPALPFTIGGTRYLTEIMRVTAGTGTSLTVERRALNSAPLTGQDNLSFNSNTVVSVAIPDENFVWQNNLGSVPIETYPFDDPRNNLTMAKLYGYLMVGLALADDDERARLMFEQAFNYWFDGVYPYNKRSWTGLTQSTGNPGYNRRHLWNIMVSWAVKNSVTPSLDLTSGDWLRNTLTYFPAMETPAQSNGIWPLSDSQADYGYDVRHLEGLMLSLALFPTDPRAQKFNYYLRTRKSLWAKSTFTTSPELLMYAMMLPGPGETAIGEVDYTATDSPHFLMSSVDLNDASASPIAAFTSRTDWGDSGTSLIMSALSRPNDHMGSYPAPGSYKLRKGIHFLAGEAGQVANDPSTRAKSNWLSIDNNDLGTIPGVGLLPNGRFDRSGGTTGWAYARINTQTAYPPAIGVTRAHRHMLHAKGADDIVIVFDQSVTGSAKDRKVRFYDFAEDYEIPTQNVTGCRLTHTLPTSSARLITQMLSSATVECSSISTIQGNPYVPGKVLINGMTGTITGQTTANLWTISKAWSDTSSTLGATAMLETVGATHEGVSVADPAIVAVMPKDGTADVQSLTYTAPIAATHYVGGMGAGYYDVTVGGNPASSGQVDSSGILAFTSASTGEVVISYSTSPPALAIATATLPDGKVDVSYSMSLSAIGGSSPYSWATSSGSLPAGLSIASSGLISGTPTESGSFTVNYIVTDAENTSTSRSLTLAIEPADPTPPPTLEIVTSSLPSASAYTPYATTLVADGGTPAYTWSLVSSNLTGVSVSSGGTLSAPASPAGQYTVSVRVTDAAAATADATLTLSVQAISPAGPPVGMTAKVDGRNVIVSYGFAGLIKSQTCTLDAGDVTMTDTGGPARRTAVMQLPESVSRTIQATCGVSVGSVAVTTGVATVGTAAITRKIAGGYTHAAIDYSADGSSWTSGDPVACTSACTVSTPALPRGVPVYVRIRRITSGSDRVVGPAEITVP